MLLVVVFGFDSEVCLFPQNATWSINSLKVYKKQLLKGHVANAAPIHFPLMLTTFRMTIFAIILTIFEFVSCL